MERLHELLKDKVRREKLNNVPSESASATKTNAPKKCWLCGCEARLRYRLKDTSSLCFSCFRTAYIALVLPFIDTDERRRSDVKTLSRIERMAEMHRAASTEHATSTDSAGMDNSSVFEPSQVSFVMSASRMRQRLQSNSSGPASPVGAASTVQQRQYWNCPRCTYVNAVSAKFCGACDFANSTTVKCPHCNNLCPLDPEAARAQRSVCANGKTHSPWVCAECSQVNTQDGDTCEQCHRPRYWACSYCTALHNASRTKDGLRYCPICGSYNTPEDVQKGQDKIEAEQKKASLMAKQQQQQQQRAPQGADGDVVFGVNDAQTLAEQQRQKEITANTARLNHRLDAIGIKRISQKSDGNCLFSALAHQLFGNEQLHYLVRSCVVAYMRDNWQDYIILFDGETEWGSYLSKMKENGTWGDELCINAASRCFCVNIHVITSDPERWHMEFQQDELGKSDSNLRDKLPVPPQADESPIFAVPNSRTGRSGGGGGGQPSATHSTTLSLFLAYLFPVHFDDVTPTEVPAVVLSDLIIPELHKILSKEGGMAPAKANPPVRSPPPTSAILATSTTSSRHPAAAPSSAATSRSAGSAGSGHAPPPSYESSSRVTTAPASAPPPMEPPAISLHSEQQQERRGSALTTSPTVERPAVPRARGPNSSPPLGNSLRLAGPQGEPNKALPPSNRPPSSRSGPLSNGSSFRQ